MATMGIGHFTLLVQDRSGRTIRELEAVSRSGRPLVGDRFQMLGATYVVHLVSFEEDPEPARTVRTYYSPQITLRPVGSRPARPNDDEDAGGARPLFPSTHDGTRSVLPFSPPATSTVGLTSAYLPLNLVANLVAVGYRVQATDFDNDKHLAAAILRSPAGQDLRETLPATFDLLSRTAKQCLVDVMVYFGEAVEAGALQTTNPVQEEGVDLTASPVELKAEKTGPHLWVLRAA